jgi:hypothetical protein
MDDGTKKDGGASAAADREAFNAAEKKARRSPTYEVTFRVDAATAKSVAAKLKAAGIADVTAQIEKVERNPSRADRLSEVEGDVADARSAVEELQQEMQDWYDNLPESLQAGEKGSMVSSAADSLQEIVDALEAADFSMVEFPGMY